MATRNIRLTLWAGRNFANRRIQFRRRGVAIRNLNAFRFNNDLSSFRVRRGNQVNDVTLVLFSRVAYQGDFRVFRGAQAVANLGNFNFDNRTSSLIFIGRNLTNEQIRQIQANRRAPQDVVEIRQ